MEKSVIKWAEFTFPPVNLLNITPSKYMLENMEPKDTVTTENFKGFQHRTCEFFPCHGDENQNCLFCYCPLAFLQCPGQYEVIESPKGFFRKDCSSCTITHDNGGWDIVQKVLIKPKYWNGK